MNECFLSMVLLLFCYCFQGEKPEELELTTLFGLMMYVS